MRVIDNSEKTTMSELGLYYGDVFEYSGCFWMVCNTNRIENSEHLDLTSDTLSENLMLCVALETGTLAIFDAETEVVNPVFATTTIEKRLAR